MNVSLLLPSEAKAPGGATAPATSIPSGGDDFLKFMGLAGKTRATDAPGETDAYSAPTPEQTVPSTDAIASNSDGDKLPSNLGTTTYLIDTSLASLRLVLRAVPPMPLSKQVKPAETGAGAETNSKVAQIMDLGQGKTVGGQNGWSRLADNARPAVDPPAANPVKSAKIAPARPPQNSVRNKSLAAATPVSQAPARSNAPAVTKKPAPSLSPPRASFPLSQPPLKITSPNVTDHPVAVAPDNPAKIPVATPHTDENQTPPPNHLAPATSVDASVAIPLISAVVTPTIPPPVPLKLAEKTVSVEPDVETAQPADMRPSTGPGGQTGRSTSNTIVRPDLEKAQRDNAPAQTADSPAPRSGGRVGPPAVLSAMASAEAAASPKAEEKVSSDPAGMVSPPAPSGPPVAAPVSVKQNKDAAPNLATISVADQVSAEPAPAPRTQVLPIRAAVTMAAGLAIAPPVAPDGAINDAVEADAAPPPPAPFTAPQPKETEDAVAADLQMVDPVEKRPATAATGQSDPLESLAAAIPVPSGSGDAAIPEPAKNSAPGKLLTSWAQAPQAPAPAGEPAPANDSKSLILPPPSPGPVANNIIDVPIATPARSADDHPPVQSGAEAAVNPPVTPSQIDGDETVPPNNLAAAAAMDASVTNPHASAANFPAPEPPPLAQTPIIAKTDFKTPPSNPSLPAAVPQLHNARPASSTPVATAAGHPAVAQPNPAPSPAPKPAHLGKAILPDSAKISLQDKLTLETLLASAPSPRSGPLATTKDPAPSLPAPATPIGTTVATNQERMKSAVNVNEFAGSTVPLLPSAGQVAPSAGVADNGSQGVITARPIEIDFSNNKDASAQWMVLNITPAGTSSPTTTANSAGSTVPVVAPFAQVERMISREVTMVRQSGAQALAVTLKVDSRTSLFLQLTNHDGQIEASVRCDKGSPAGLDTHWSELQESLARQNVQLLPLQDNSRDQSKTPPETAGDFPGQQPSHKQPESRPELAAETEPPPSDDAMNAAVGLAKSKHRTHPRHGWEKWA